jgi:hypothetical protein
MGRQRNITPGEKKLTLRQQPVRLSNDARRMPVFLDAGSGSGKSRLLGRLWAWQDFLRWIAILILDPHGMTIDNFLDKLSRLPAIFPLELRERLWQRVRYIDMSGKLGFITPFPLYYRLGNESLYEIAQRYIDVVRKIDPNLQNAAIEGYNAFKRVAANVGMLLAAMDYQITEAAHLLRSPEAWLDRARNARSIYGPELDPAIAFLTEYQAAKVSPQPRLTASFFNKVDQFELDPTMRAMFGTGIPGIDWQEVLDKRQIVLLDFRHVDDLERRQFLMMWAYQYLMSFIRHRGPGRHEPVSLIVDELAALFPMSGLVASQFAADLDEMINQIARNYSLWVTLATQELYQFDERLQKTLMSMTLLQGRTSDPESATMLAQRLNRYDPYKVKMWENVWGSSSGFPIVVEKRPVLFTPEEQQILASYHYMDLQQFEFEARLPRGEGNYTGGTRSFSIATLDPGHFPDEELVAEARRLLVQRDGTPISAALEEIAARREPRSESKKRTRGRKRKTPPVAIEASGELDD